MDFCQSLVLFSFCTFSVAKMDNVLRQGINFYLLLNQEGQQHTVRGPSRARKCFPQL
jgi:hypothetical protein